MKKQIILIATLLLLAANSSAEISIQSFDINTGVAYTLSDIGIDINIATNENKATYIQLWDNNVKVKEVREDLNSADGNNYYYSYNFTLQFTEGQHYLDLNVSDTNYNKITSQTITFDVLANPLTLGSELSWELIQQYILPISRSLSECLVEKTDLNAQLIRNDATLRALENNLGIAENDKVAAEQLLTGKKQELESCNTARGICESDLATTQAKYSNAQNECDGEKAELERDEEENCDNMLVLKDETIALRDTRILEQSEENNYKDALAFAFGIGNAGLILLFAFLFFKGRIKI